MIIRALFIFLVLLASVMLGLQLEHDPGYVLLQYRHWTIETTIWVALLVLVLTVIILHIFLSLCQWAIHLPSSFRQWLTKRRIHQSQLKTRQGLIEFSEGHWQQAKNHLIQAVPAADTPLVNYLTAARAAQEMGENQLRDDYLRQAQQSMPEASIAVGLTQAQLQLAHKQWEQALATLRHLQDLAPNHPHVLKLLMQLYEDMKDWPQLLALLPELKRNHVVTSDAYDTLQQHVYLQTMLALIKQNQSQKLLTFVSHLPKHLLNNPELMTTYCQYLLNNNEASQAELVLRRCLRKVFNEQLIQLYGQINSNDAQLTFAESWLTAHPHSPALLLCLGRLSKAQNLWGKAKSYYEQSIEQGATTEAYIELGTLLEQLNDQTGACAAYRQGLIHTAALSTKAKPEVIHNPLTHE